MSAWIFQGNPDRFDIDGYLRNSKNIYWSVTIQKYQKMITVGDSIFIWRAKGSQKLESGIVAFGTVFEECKPKQEVQRPEWLSESLWVDQARETSDIKAGISLKGVRLSRQEGMISSEIIKLDPQLSNMQIVTARTGSNFQISPAQYIRLLALWNAQDAEDVVYYDPNYSTAEGKTVYRIHKFRERDGSLSKHAKDQFAQKHGRLFCEICGFDFTEKYKGLGENYIEIHHKKPVHTLQPGESTMISDLMMVCANCHRVIHHKGDPTDNLSSLLEMFN